MKKIDYTGKSPTSVSKATVALKAQTMGERMMIELDELRTQYWDAHSALATETFSHWSDQDAAIRKLSQLGLALEAYGKAYSAMNIARYN